MRNHTATRTLTLLAAAASCFLLVAAGALNADAASVRLSLNLQGGYANRQLTACGIKHHYTFFHPRHTITLKGTLTPAPTGAWQVKLKVKQCLRGSFRTIWAIHVPGHPGGSFTGGYPARRHGYFFARVYYYGVTPAERSDKQYFRIP